MKFETTPVPVETHSNGHVPKPESEDLPLPRLGEKATIALWGLFTVGVFFVGLVVAMAIASLATGVLAIVLTWTVALFAAAVAPAVGRDLAGRISGIPAVDDGRARGRPKSAY